VSEPDSESERAASWAALLSQPPIARLMPTGKVRADLLVDAGEALTRPPDLEGYVRGCRHTATGRTALLWQSFGGAASADRSVQARGSLPAEEGTRQERVRSSTALREMVAFMLSDDYAP